MAQVAGILSQMVITTVEKTAALLYNNSAA